MRLKRLSSQVRRSSAPHTGPRPRPAASGPLRPRASPAARDGRPDLLARHVHVPKQRDAHRLRRRILEVGVDEPSDRPFQRIRFMVEFSYAIWTRKHSHARRVMRRAVSSGVPRSSRGVRAGALILSNLGVRAEDPLAQRIMTDEVIHKIATHQAMLNNHTRAGMVVLEDAAVPNERPHRGDLDPRRGRRPHRRAGRPWAARPPSNVHWNAPGWLPHRCADAPTRSTVASPFLPSSGPCPLDSSWSRSRDRSRPAAWRRGAVSR